MKRAAPVIRWAASPRGSKRIRRAYRTYTKARWAAGKIQRNWRAKRAARRSVGHPVGQSNAKRHDDNVSNAVGFYNRLYSHPITWPSRGTNLDQRIRDVINLRGIKVCAEFHTTSTGTNEEFYVNYAIVTDKRRPNDATLADTHFFRGTDQQRTVDFNSNQVGLGIHKHCIGLNTDRFTVFMHRRWKMTTGGSHNHILPTTKTIMKYIPIKRQIRFNEDNTPDTKFWAVWWYTLVGTTQANIEGTADIVHMNQHFVKYYRETHTV